VLIKIVVIQTLLLAIPPLFALRMAVHTLHEYICWIIDNVQGLLMIIIVFFILFNAVRKGRKIE
jgi:hypothetical protein